MSKQARIIIILAVVIVTGWVMYLYYDLIQFEKKALAELSKPKGWIGLENKSNLHSVIKITNSNNDLVYWSVFTPGGAFASYGGYDTGDITLELIRNEKIINSVKFELNEGGNAKFYVYKDEIKPE